MLHTVVSEPGHAVVHGTSTACWSCGHIQKAVGEIPELWVVTKNETCCGIPWTTPQVLVHITEGIWVSNRHNFVQALYCVFCYRFS